MRLMRQESFKFTTLALADLFRTALKDRGVDEWLTRSLAQGEVRDEATVWLKFPFTGNDDLTNVAKKVDPEVRVEGVWEGSG